MTEIKETLAILKTRWPEVCLIIGLNVLCVFVKKLLPIVQAQITPLQRLIDLFYLLALTLIIMLLTVAFQRTIYLEDKKRQSPIVLLCVGMHFFWRMLGFGLIFLFVYMFLTRLIFFAIKPLAYIETGFFEIARDTPIVYQLCFTTAILILIKPLLLVFPLIVVLDCSLYKSFKLLKQCKLLDARELIILFFISHAVTFLWVFLPSIKSATTIFQIFLMVVWTIIQRFIGLMVLVISVRFVASLNLVYDVNSGSLSSQDLLKHPIKN